VVMVQERRYDPQLLCRADDDDDDDDNDDDISCQCDNISLGQWT